MNSFIQSPPGGGCNPRVCVCNPCCGRGGVIIQSGADRHTDIHTDRSTDNETRRERQRDKDTRRQRQRPRHQQDTSLSLSLYLSLSPLSPLHISPISFILSQGNRYKLLSTNLFGTPHVVYNPYWRPPGAAKPNYEQTLGVFDHNLRFGVVRTKEG